MIADFFPMNQTNNQFYLIYFDIVFIVFAQSLEIELESFHYSAETVLNQSVDILAIKFFDDSAEVQTSNFKAMKNFWFFSFAAAEISTIE